MIDKNKKYKTRCGRNVKIYEVYEDNSWPVHGAIYKNEWHISSWKADGTAGYENDPYDLIEVSEWRDAEFEDLKDGPVKARFKHTKPASWKEGTLIGTYYWSGKLHWMRDNESVYNYCQVYIGDNQ